MKIMKIVFALMLVLAMAQIATAIPATLDEVEFDDIELQPSAENRVSIERGDEYEVRVKFTALEDIENAEVRAFISGFEYGDVDAIEDNTPVFDADAGVTYVKKLRLRVPDDIDRDSYKLRVVVSDRFGDGLTENYNLKVDVPRHAIKIEDVMFSPENAVRSGSALLATVRIENKGERDESDVRVMMNIPGLGVSDTKYIEEIENEDEEEETEELFLRIPKCSKPGVYDVNIDVEYSRRHKKISATRTITVLEDTTCNTDGAPKTTITLGQQVQDVAAGGTGVFPITVTNAGKNSKTFTVTVPTEDWATVSVTPTSTLVVPSGQTQTVYVNVEVSEDATAGAQSLVATVTSGEQVNDLSLTVNVSSDGTSLKGVFEIILVVLVVLLVILGIIIGVSRFRQDDQPEAYY